MFNRKMLIALFAVATLIAVVFVAILAFGEDNEGGDAQTTDTTVNDEVEGVNVSVGDTGSEERLTELNDGNQRIGDDQVSGQQGQAGETNSSQGSGNAAPLASTQAAQLPSVNTGASDDEMALNSSPDDAVMEPASESLRATPAPTQVAAEPDVEESPPVEIVEAEAFTDTSTDHLSTFSMDVDTGSYTIARNYLTSYGQLPPAYEIRTEEMINYFDAHYDGPEGNAPFAIHVDAAPSPFEDDDTYLMRVGIQGRYISPEDRDAALLIFVIDVSGSMDQLNRLPLAKNALGILVNELREDDRVGIVVYSDNSRIILDPTPASEKETILDAIASLQNEGSTNMNAGLELGYQMAEAYQSDSDGITRVILLSDGVANVGPVDFETILENAREKAAEDITLSTIGFGLGEYNDTLMEQLADNGDGSYYYIDNIRQARRVFVHQLTGTLQVIAFDARIQVDFNPDVVAEYRLIGYDNRAIADEDFRNDEEVDAAEIGAGHSVTGLYEIRLQPNADNANIATVYVRYQNAETTEFEEINRDFPSHDLFSDFDDMPATFRLHAVVAEFGEMLRGTNPDGDYVELLAVATPLVDALANDPDVTEFVDLIRLAGQYVDTGQ